MTRLSRKCVWVIVLVVFVAGMITFFGWATSGFRNWDSATWFDYWGKGKSAKVVKVAEKPAEQKAMAFTSADGENSDEDNTPEFILDSEDGIATFATIKLPAPQLSMDYDNRVLRVEVSGTVGEVIIFRTAWNDLSYSTSNIFLTLSSSRFTSTSPAVCEVSFNQIYTSLKTAAGQFANMCDEVGAPCFGLFAKNTKTNYLTSNNSEMLILAYFPVTSPITAFEGNEYVITGLSNAWMTTIGFNHQRALDLNVYSSVNTDAAALQSLTVGNGGIKVSGKKGSVDLLFLSKKLATQPSSEVYHFVLTYKPLVLELNSKLYTFYPLLMTLTKTDSFTVTRLATPTNFKFNEGNLTWDSVIGATQYGVFWTEGETEMKAFVGTPSYSFDIAALGEGEHTVRVRALGNLAQTAVDNGQTMSITAYNAANVVTQVVALTYNIDGDVVTKFVPYGSKVTDYIYDVNMKGREFGGWFYDSGFSRKVEKSDVLNGDTTIYARLSDKKVTERPLTWWEQHMWQVLGPVIAVAALGIIAGVIVGIRKKKAA